MKDLEAWEDWRIYKWITGMPNWPRTLYRRNGGPTGFSFVYLIMVVEQLSHVSHHFLLIVGFTCSPGSCLLCLCSRYICTALLLCFPVFVFDVNEK